AVTPRRGRPVAVCVIVTVAPGRTAPLESVTRPLISAVESWAQAGATVSSAANSTANAHIDNPRPARPMTPPFELGAYSNPAGALSKRAPAIVLDVPGRRVDNWPG